MHASLYYGPTGRLENCSTAAFGGFGFVDVGQGLRQGLQSPC